MKRSNPTTEDEDCDDLDLSFETRCKSPRLSTDASKCLKCQNKSNEKLCKAMPSSILNFFEASKIRKDDVFERLKLEETMILDTEQYYYWHMSCYKEYTNKTKLERILLKRGPSKGVTEQDDISLPIPNEKTPVKVMRSSVAPLNWDLCVFCQNITKLKSKTLSQVETMKACQVILESARIRNDTELLVKLSGVDLIAQEVKYHAMCYSSYTSKSNLKYFEEEQGKIDSQNEKQLAEGFSQLVKEIDFELFHQKKALNMSVLTERYRIIVSGRVPNIETYRNEKLKRRLMNHYGDKIVFHDHYDKSKPQFIYSSEISLQDAINTAAKLTGMINETDENDMVHEIDQNNNSVILQTATLLRHEIKGCNSLNTNPVNPKDISVEKAYEIVPVNLYNLIKWTIEGPNEETLNTDVKDMSRRENVNRQVLSIGQDLIYCVSKGSVRTPKHIGLAVSIKHMTGSKKVVTMLNRFGHTVNYDELQRIDTAIADNIIKSYDRDTLIPSNISVGTFVHAAADNIDINEETLDGLSTTHATSMVLYQKKINGNFAAHVRETDTGYSSKNHARNRVLKQKMALTEIEEFSRLGKRPSPKFADKIELQWFEANCTEMKCESTDALWMFARLCPEKMFEVNLYRDPKQQSVPGWSAFNALVCVSKVDESSIGYCPLIKATPTEYSTIYTVMRTIQKNMSKLNQNMSVLTFDEAIYSKAKEIQWKCSEQFEDIILRMGGFHIALNFLGVIGHIYEGSGLEDIFIEAGLYGSSTVCRFLKGKMYNRGVRAHKLLLEALLRLQWQAFCDWVGDKFCEEEVEICNTSLKNMQDALRNKDSEKIPQSLKAMEDVLSEKVSDIHQQFISQQRESSDTFAFWTNYMNMVLLLLDYIRAEREGHWERHLSAVTEMIPYFFVTDHQNYAKWCSVYVADMNLLEKSSAETLNAFQEGHHVVSRSGKPFSAVWSDMALEQSANCHSKSKSGIIGFSKQEGALDRWFLTAHERASITAATNSMCDIKEEDESLHKEGGKARIERDEADVQKLTTALTTIISDPFKDDGDKPLRNICTGTVLPEDISKELLEAKSKGDSLMKNFVEKRLIEKEVSFFSPMPKTKVKTFETAVKKVSVTDSKEKAIVSVNADRQLFGRLVVVAKSRDVDLNKVLQHELSNVPLSLAKPDGTLNKGTKSKLLTEIEKEAVTFENLPTKLNCAWILDGMAQIQMVKKGGAFTFGELADIHFGIIQSIFRTEETVRIDIVFDRYDVKDSIKSMERSRRQTTDMGLEVKIQNPSTPLPRQWEKYISNPKNKTSLVKFISNYLVEKATSSLQPGHILIIGGGLQSSNQAMCIRNGNAVLIRRLTCSHEEADTRMLLHASHAADTVSRVVIASPDTDVAVLGVHFAQTIGTEIWFKTGVKDLVRYIPIHDIARELGSEICESLPAFHAITGCDSTSCLCGKGKPRGWGIFRKEIQNLKNLKRLGESMTIEPIVQETVNHFISLLYSTSSDGDVNSLRYKLFCQKQATNEKLPPTQDSLTQHTKRANYQTYIWRNALTAELELPSPIGNGWHRENEILVPTLLTNSPAPTALLELTRCGCLKGCTRGCKCKKISLACTQACACSGDEDCLNPFTAAISSDEESDDDINSDDDEDMDAL